MLEHLPEPHPPLPPPPPGPLDWLASGPGLATALAVAGVLGLLVGWWMARRRYRGAVASAAATVRPDPAQSRAAAQRALREAAASRTPTAAAHAAAAIRVHLEAVGLEGARSRTAAELARWRRANDHSPWLHLLARCETLAADPDQPGKMWEELTQDAPQTPAVTETRPTNNHTATAQGKEVADGARP